MAVEILLCRGSAQKLERIAGRAPKKTISNLKKIILYTIDHDNHDNHSNQFRAKIPDTGSIHPKTKSADFQL